MCRLLYFVHILVLASHFEHGQVLGFHSVSVVRSFIHSFCVFLRLSNYNIVCSVVMSLPLLLEKVSFSSLVLLHL